MIFSCRNLRMVDVSALLWIGRMAIWSGGGGAIMIGGDGDDESSEGDADECGEEKGRGVDRMDAGDEDTKGNV